MEQLWEYNLISKRRIFRWLVNTFDELNHWFTNTFNLNPKRAILEKKQDATTLKELDRTIGKHLGIK